jgi:hypothetical protein
MSPSLKGSAAGVTTPPESAVRKSLHRCAERFAYVGQLATIAAETGRAHQGAAYIIDELNDLAGDIAVLRAFVEERQVSTQ